MRRQRRDDASQRHRSVVTEVDDGVVAGNTNGKMIEIGGERRIDLEHVVACCVSSFLRLVVAGKPQPSPAASVVGIGSPGM